MAGGTRRAAETRRNDQEAPAPKTGRYGRPVVDKVGNRRVELAEAALETLAELGYANTSLRDIANNSEFTHGVLHYYFKDKLDLISCAVQHYKATCVTRYDQATVAATTREELVEGIVSKLGETLESDALMHRLWYDLRSQAMFESGFRGDIVEIDTKLESMIWRIGARLSELSGQPVGLSSAALYGLFDGLFQRALLRHLAKDPHAIRDFQKEMRKVLSHLAA